MNIYNIVLTASYMFTYASLVQYNLNIPKSFESTFLSGQNGNIMSQFGESINKSTYYFGKTAPNRGLFAN